MSLRPALKRQVRKRAGDRCEYCHLPQAVAIVKFEIDHIVASKHHGPYELSNLALSCWYCNSAKGPNIAGKDPLTGVTTPLFNPREDAWERHFEWDGAILLGLTATGRTTIDVLRINDEYVVEVRESLILEGKFP
jgi:hypothetical protein